MTLDDYKQLKQECVVNNLYIRSVEDNLRAAQMKMDKTIEVKTRALVAELDAALHREMDRIGVKLTSSGQAVVDTTLNQVKAENERLRSEFMSIKQTEDKLVGIVERLIVEVKQLRDELTAVKGVLNTTQNDLATTNVTIAANRQADRREREDKQKEIVQLIDSKERDTRNMHQELLHKVGRSINIDNLHEHLEPLLSSLQPKTEETVRLGSNISTDERIKRLDLENTNRKREIEKVRAELLGETGHIMQMLSQQQQRPRGFGRRF